MEQDGFPVAQSAVSNMERNVKALIPTREQSTTEPYPLFINVLPRNWTSHPVRWLYSTRTRPPSNQQFTNGGKTYSHYIKNWPTKQSQERMCIKVAHAIIDLKTAAKQRAEFMAKHTFTDAERHSDNAICTRHAIETTDEVRHVVKNRQIVLHNDDVLIGREKIADRHGSTQPLLHIQVTRRLVEHKSGSHTNVNKAMV